MTPPQSGTRAVLLDWTHRKVFGGRSKSIFEGTFALCVGASVSKHHRLVERHELCTSGCEHLLRRIPGLPEESFGLPSIWDQLIIQSLLLLRRLQHFL